MSFPEINNEQERLQAVNSYEIYGTGPEAAFDGLTDLAAQIAQTPIALINIIGQDNIWAKSSKGLPPDLVEVPRSALCCAHTICQSDLFVVPDLHDDERFQDFPFIGSQPFLRFYAGMPLIDPNGYALGTLCLMDLQPRKLEFEITEGIRRLANQAMAQIDLRIKLTEMKRIQSELHLQKERAETLIHNILPVPIAAELADHGTVAPRHHDAVTIVFSDFVDFTKRAEKIAPRELVDELNLYFSEFDTITKDAGVEKIKTIGDAYMCAAGLVDDAKDHAVKACLAGLNMQSFVENRNSQRAKLGMEPWILRVGVHTGSVMSGVVGKHKYTYDIWGDAVNVSARVETASTPGGVTISQSTYDRVKDYFICEARGLLEMKNKAPIDMFFVIRLKPEYSSDANGLQPNEALNAALSGIVSGWFLS